MRILLVNDDGIQSPGLRRLAEALADNHRVTVAAPEGQRSAVGHGLTMRMPLLAEKTPFPKNLEAWAISGTPADCTRVALEHFAPDADLVISGPNYGLNVAFDVLYSGTVSAALEAAMHGVPAIAVSAPPEADLENVLQIFLTVFSQLDIKRDIRHVLNINIPALPLEQVKGVKWVPQGLFMQWHDSYQHGVSPTGQVHYWIGGTELPLPQEQSDAWAVREGYVALTPLSYRLTDDQGFCETEFQL